MVEDGLYFFSLCQCSVEQQFQVEGALFLRCVRKDHAVAVHTRLEEECIIGGFVDALFRKEQSVGNLHYRLVQQYVRAVDDGDVVEQTVDISHLMRRDHN